MTKKRLLIIVSLIISFTIVYLTNFFFLNKDNPKSFSLNLFKKTIKKISFPKLTLISKKNILPTPTLVRKPIKPTTPFFITLTPPPTKPAPTNNIFPNQTTVQKVTPTKIPPSPTKIPPSPTRTIPSPTNSLSLKSTISQSKLGIFVLVGLSNGAKKIIAAGSKIIKFIDPQGNQEMLNIVKEYKKQYPQGITVLRFWNRTPGIHYTVNNNPETSSQDFFNRVHQPAFQELGENLRYFDYLQTPNEFETTPEWWGEEKIRWNGRFWLKLTQLNKNYGIKTCIGGIPVGNVEANELGYIIQELKQMKNLGAAFCYHGYTFNYSTNVNEEIQLSLRYRQFYNFFRQNAPELISMPLILSEGGVAENGNPKAGYLISNSAEKYKSWLSWYDNEIRKDPYVIGVTLFQIGNTTDWSYFDLEPISNWLSSYIRSQ